MKYLVTGGAGFIGSNLVRRLVSEGHYCRVLDNLSRGAARRLESVSDKVDIITQDIRDPSWTGYAADIDGIIHLADINGTEHFYSQPMEVMDIAIRGMQNVLDACRRNNIQNLYVASSSEVYHDPGIFPTPESVPLVIPDPLNPRYSYACGKIVKEMMTLHSGLERAVIFRPHNAYGPDMGEHHVIPQLVRKFAADNFTILGNGLQTRSFCHIDDFTEGLLILLTAETGIYHVGNPEEVRVAELASKIAKIMGVTPHHCAESPAPMGETRRRVPDISKMKALGWEPKIMLDDGLPEVVDWYANN